jgi:hypothetical protein
VLFDPGGDSRTPTCRSASASARRPGEALIVGRYPLGFNARKRSHPYLTYQDSLCICSPCQ